MLGAIVGDIAGSVYEFNPLSGNWDSFPLFSPKVKFTDDTVMSMATARAIREADEKGLHLQDLLIDSMRGFGRKWPRAGYGGRFARWLVQDNPDPYNSFGNGSAMRVSPAGWAARSLEEAEQLADTTAAVTHNHPEGIKGAQAVAGAIFLARMGKTKEDIRDYISEKYAYDLSRSLEEIRKDYSFDETCQGSVPEALTAFMESDNFEQTVRKAIWLRGDADTQAAIAGSIAEAFYGGIPEDIANQALEYLDKELLNEFQAWNGWLQKRTA